MIVALCVTLWVWIRKRAPYPRTVGYVHSDTFHVLTLLSWAVAQT